MFKFATKARIGHVNTLILFSALWWVSLSLAQTQTPAQAERDEAPNVSANAADATANRRIKRWGEGNVDDWELDIALTHGQAAGSVDYTTLSLPDEVQNQQLQQLLARLAIDARDEDTLSQLESLLVNVMEQLNAYLDDGLFEQSSQLLLVVKSIDPDFRGLSAARIRVKTLYESITLMQAGYAALESRQVLEPEKINANYYFNRALSKNPGSEGARLGLASMPATLVDIASESVHERDFTSASEWLSLAAEVRNEQKQQEWLAELKTSPGYTGVLEQLHMSLGEVLVQVNGLLDRRAFEQADELLPLIQSVEPAVRGLASAKHRLNTLADVERLLSAASRALKADRVVKPEDNNALYYFNLVLDKNAQNQKAQHGLERVQVILVDRALQSIRDLDIKTADYWLFKASAVREDQELVQNARLELATFEKQRVIALEQQAISAMDSGQYILAEFSIVDLTILGGQEARVAHLNVRLGQVRANPDFDAGEILVDDLLRSGGKAPQIVVIPSGSFVMGSDGHSVENYDNESPQHEVTIERVFGLGVHEVTVDEFRLFIEKTGYRTAAERRGLSYVYAGSEDSLKSRAGVHWRHDYRGKKARPKSPVIHVNADDAQAYVNWLANETGKSYRLPSEAEYEYVARAGGNGSYWWGEGSPDGAVENLTGERDSSMGQKRWSAYFSGYGDGHWGPALTGSITDGKMAHPMGVYDIAGNVSEWTADCWHQNYVLAPADGSAWVKPDCDQRVARGGYWASAPRDARAAFRMSAHTNTHGPMVGIRIARDL